VLLCLQASDALQYPDRCPRFSVTSTQCPSLHRHHSACADLFPTTSRRCCNVKGEVHSGSPHLRPPTQESAFFVCFSQRLPEWISVSFQDRITSLPKGSRTEDTEQPSQPRHDAYTRFKAVALDFIAWDAIVSCIVSHLSHPSSISASPRQDLDATSSCVLSLAGACVGVFWSFRRHHYVRPVV
jgi:hypothetical protein